MEKDKDKDKSRVHATHNSNKEITNKVTFPRTHFSSSRHNLAPPVMSVFGGFVWVASTINHKQLKNKARLC